MKKKYLTATALILAGALIGCGTKDVDADESESQESIAVTSTEALSADETVESENEIAETKPIRSMNSNLPTDEVIYEDESISITLGDITESYIGPELQFNVTNKTDKEMYVLIMDLCLNDIYLPGVYYSDYVGAATEGTISLDIPYDTFYNYTLAMDDPTLEQLSFTVLAKNENDEVFLDYVPVSFASTNCPDTFDYNVKPEPLFETEYYAVYDMGYAYTDNSNMAHFNFLIYTKESDSVALFYSGIGAEMGAAGGMIENTNMISQTSLPCGSYFLYQAQFNKADMSNMGGQGIVITAWPLCYTDSMNTVIEVTGDTISSTANDYVDYSEEINNALTDSETLSPEDDYMNAMNGN